MTQRSMRLSDFYHDESLIRDSHFSLLGYVDSSEKDTLAYCDVYSYLVRAMQNENVTCVITTGELADYTDDSKGLIVSSKPRNAFFRLHDKLVEKDLIRLEIECGIGENCSIHPTATISKRSKIGNNVIINENVVIKDNVTIGDNTFIDAGAVIGCEGLLYIVEDDKKISVRHAGGVKVGSNVTILSNAVIARSINNSCLTEIGDYSIIGIATNIGHEARIGANCVISGNCVIARRAFVNEDASIESSAFVREHVIIGKGAQVKAGSIVVKDVDNNQAVSGNFAMEHSRNLRLYMRNSK
jgi:acyl-[acyl carrier protein]--UDP-N-acetylglucosamine O-acyltransferase